EDEGGGSERVGTDSDVAEGAHCGRKQRAEIAAAVQRPRYPARGSGFAAVSQYLSALVRQEIPSQGWSGELGQSTTDPLCGRFRGSGSVSKQPSQAVDRRRTGRVVRIGDQSRKDSYDPTQGGKCDPGFPRVQFSIREGSERSTRGGT